MNEQNYKIELDLHRDFLEIIKQDLAAYNYEVDIDHEEPDEIKIKYYNFFSRIVARAERTVLVSKELACPYEVQQGFDQVKQKIEAGEDLFPHLSTKIKDLEYNDDLLNDWGIHHLHLGTGYRSDGFIERTGHILFVRFTSKTAYLIDVMPHDAFNKQHLLRVIHSNWPESIEMYRLKGEGEMNFMPTDNDVKSFRKAGINTFIELAPGAVYIPPGGGITMGKIGENVADNVLRSFRELRDFEEKIKGDINRIRVHLATNYGYSGNSYNFKLNISKGYPVVIEENTKAEFTNN